ncbi:hypothetical protein CSUI_001574 [Cystoisospora suis]|uniref:Uncharacterized protein n=1 Tax=Cystoisospora suis TaxID=483139 RepID=A0A2C6LC89_9APIC|nr:hypothetical protein CSUI_001574 [Cystoisospora suis]
MSRFPLKGVSHRQNSRQTTGYKRYLITSFDENNRETRTALENSK